MSAYSDLEITLSKRGASSYAAGFRFLSPGDAAEQSFPSDEGITLDVGSLRGKRGSDYSAALTSAFFSTGVSNALMQALALSRDRLRVRISIEPSASELHQIHWELLNDPRKPDSPLFMGENIVCSRFLTSSQDWRRIELGPKSLLRALVVAANPKYLSDGEGYDDEDSNRLAPVDTKGETDRASAALKGIEVKSGAATLSAIIEELRRGVDILYLVCHGVLQKGVPLLHLEEHGPVDGRDFVERIRELDRRPRLVVLASCESAGTVGTALAALGPLLAEAGVPAVIAMQGKVSMAMIARFMPRLFSELLQDGQIDRAMSVARGEVRDSKQDYWMPALFLRLRDGRIWVEAPASAPARKDEGESDEDNDGDLVPLLCDRQPQEQTMFERFMGARPGAPQMYFLPGREDASHESFVTRVQYNLVPKLLGEDSESLRHQTQFISAEWVQKFPEGSELPYLTAKLAWQIDGKLKGDAAMIKKHPKIAGNIVIIQHRLYAKYWNNKMAGLLRDYATFWSKAADDVERPLILIFFNVVFDSATPPTVPAKALKALAKECVRTNMPCSVTVLDPLGDVEWEHVEEWLVTNFPRRMNRADDLRQSLFASGTTRPMKQVEPKLREFAG